MLEVQRIKKKKKLVNNRRKSRELVMKSIYRGILNQFDINQIKKDIKDDPDYLKADEVPELCNDAKTFAVLVAKLLNEHYNKK